MSLWKKEEYSLVKNPTTNVDVVFSGAISGGVTVVTTADSVDLTDLFSVGDIIRVVVSGATENLSVISVEETQLTVTKSSATFSGTVYKLNVPTFIKDPSLKGIVSYIDYSEATSEFFREIGVKSPGWVTSFTYQDQNGNTRHKSENLVVVKGKIGQ